MKNNVSLRMFLWMALLTGVFYPLFITSLSYLFWYQKSHGDLVFLKEKVVGSRHIGQKFTSDRYFWPRPSFSDYQPLEPGASNWGLTSKALEKAFKERKEMLSKSANNEEIPAEMLFASGSGLDPHISPEAAYFQMDRVAKARGKQHDDLKALIEKNTESEIFGLIGIPLVNVLKLNMALDEEA